MKPDNIFWIALAAYAFHILEEFSYDWKSWAQKILKLNVDWNHFYVTNVTMLFLGIACAEVGWSTPAFSLIFPGMMLVNAIVFHILPYIRSQRTFSPGLFTAIFLFLPIGFVSFRLATELGVFTKSLIIAGAGAVVTVLFPIFLLKTKDLDYFKS